MAAFVYNDGWNWCRVRLEGEMFSVARAFRSIWLAVLFVLAGVHGAPNALAANVFFLEEMRDGYADKVIWLEGEITDGDAKKISEIARQFSSRGWSANLWLNSPGGSVPEALKIAALVREMWMNTVVHAPDTTIEQRQVRTCDSACVVVFLAGVDRSVAGRGMIYMNDAARDRQLEAYATQVKPLGLHRPYFLPQFNASLSPEQSMKAYAELEAAYRSALAEYGAPDSLIARIFKTPSDKMDRISGEEFEAMMPRRVPWYHEYSLSKCGPELSQVELRAAWDGDPAATAHLIRRGDCERKIRIVRQKEVLAKMAK